MRESETERDTETGSRESQRKTEIKEEKRLTMTRRRSMFFRRLITLENTWSRYRLLKGKKRRERSTTAYVTEGRGQRETERARRRKTNIGAVKNGMPDLVFSIVTQP